MGMGTFACGADTISYENLKRICPDEIRSIEEDSNFAYTGWFMLGRAIDFDDWEMFSENALENLNSDDEKLGVEIADNFKNKVKTLCENFNKTTNLELYLSSYDADNGDRYDEPNDHEGCVFSVAGVYQYTPAGEKYKDVIVKSQWTQFG